MDSSPRLDDEDGFGGNFTGSGAPGVTASLGSSGRLAGEKRAFADLDDEDDDIFAAKKEAEEAAPGAATGMILTLRESLQNCKDNLASCQEELETTRTEIERWRNEFQNSQITLRGSMPEPGLVVMHLQSLRSSDESLKEQLEKAKKKEAAFIVTFAKREQEIAELKSAIRNLKMQLRPRSLQTRRLLLDPAIHEEFTRLKNLVEEKEKKIKELQENVAAVNFTPSTKLGKMLMAKCRTLQEENEEIGAMASEGKMQELGVKIGVLKTENLQLRAELDALCKSVGAVTNDVERSNEMVLVLQSELRKKDKRIQELMAMLAQKETPGDAAVRTPENEMQTVKDEEQIVRGDPPEENGGGHIEV